MAETPRRAESSAYWQSVIEDLEAQVLEFCRRAERSKRRAKKQRELRRLEQAKNTVLRDRLKRLEEQVRSLGGLPNE